MEAFTPAQVQKASKACTAMCMWVRAMHKYHQVSVMVEPKKKLLAEATAELEETMQKLRGAKTDPARLRRSDKGTPEVCNIYSYHGFFSSQEQRDEVAEGCRSASLGCVDCKKLLAQNMETVKGPIRERAAALRSKPDQVDEILAAGAAKAGKTAEETMTMVRERIGIAGGKS